MKEKTDILFIVPHQPESAKILSAPSGITPPHGIGYIASYLEMNGFKPRILDNSIEHLDSKQFQDYLVEVAPEAVGFTVCSSSYNTALFLAGLVKKFNRDIPVIMGGVQPSALPREVLKNPVVDFVVKGEGEITILQLLKALKSKRDFSKINGIFFRKGNEIVENSPRDFILDIDSLPFPAYHLLPMDRYSLPASRRLTTKKVASIITSRGCPYVCTFCSHNSIFQGKIRLRSPENVIAEIKYLVEKFDVGELLVWDDSFLFNKSRALEICRLIKKHKLNITWSCSSRVDQISEELVKEMYSAGCRLILFGAESGSQTILNSIQKRTTVEQIKNAVGICQRNKIMTFCSFILGTPEETEETVEETLRFASKLNTDYVIFTIFAPLPGSILFNKFVSEGVLQVENIDWDRYINLMSSAPPLMVSSKLSPERLIQIQKKAFQMFYFRPRYIMSRLLKINSREQLNQCWRGLKALIKLQAHKFSST